MGEQAIPYYPTSDVNDHLTTNDTELIHSDLGWSVTMGVRPEWAVQSHTMTTNPKTGHGPRRIAGQVVRMTTPLHSAVVPIP